MKVDKIQDEEGRRYVKVWIKALKVMLGWSETKTLKWAEKWEDELTGADSGLFFNGTPGSYILNLLIPDSIRDGLSSLEVGHLRETLLCVIERQDCFCYWRPNFDWKKVKQRVDAFLVLVAYEKEISRRGLKPFLLKYQKGILTRKPTKRQLAILRKTYVK